MSNEKEKERIRENRLNKIQTYLTEVLKESSLKDAEKYKIVYKPIKHYKDSIFKTENEVLPSQSPAYGFFLTLKSDPKKGYSIMHLFKEDINKRVKNEDIKTYYQIPAFEENMVEGIKYLKTATSRKDIKEKSKIGGLEKTLGIILILGLLSSIFLISSNFTGFTILDITKKHLNIIGFIFLILGFVIAFIYFKRK